MLVYDQFTGDDMSWNPRIVDELTLDEVFWLPRVKEAKAMAGRTLAAIQDMQQPPEYPS